MLVTGIHKNIPIADYLALDALSSTQLGWFAKSPRHYRYLMDHPAEADPDTDSTALGSAVHTAALEPELFAATYCLEPDPSEVAPDAKSPRATNAYKAAVTLLRESGQIVLKAPQFAQVTQMADRIMSYGPAARLLAKCPGRELTLSWRRDGLRPCRGRADVLGDGVLADIKTTRSLRKFSPFAVTQYAYHRQMAWYADGLRRLGLEIKLVYFIVIESEAPCDIGVFALDSDCLTSGELENDRLVYDLAECEFANRWPGMFNDDVQSARVTDTWTAEVEIQEAENAAQ